jgi:diguanylate cyclase (GGDEF)-like protein/PAS domain S-box-containing protein
MRPKSTIGQTWLRFALLSVVLGMLSPIGGPAARPAPADVDQQTFLSRLSEAERAWLHDHKEIRLGVDPAWEPFEFLDDSGRYRGMAADYIELLNAMLHVNMAPARGLSWSEVIEKATAAQIDVLPCVVKTPQREEYLNFTRSYLNFPMVIVTRDDASFVGGLEDLQGKRVGVVTGYATADLLQSHFPDLQRVEFDNLQQGLEALSLGQIPAFVDNLASIADVITKRGFTNIKVAAQTPFSFELSLGVRKDWPELVGILDKALAAISAPQADQIRKNWISIKFEYGVDTAYLLRIALFASSLAIVIFGIIFHWNRRLLAEVEQRKHVEDVLAHRNQIHESIAAGADLDQVLSTLVANVESERRGALGAVILLDAQGTRVTRILAPELPSDYKHGLEGAPVSDCLACCAEAIQWKGRVVQPDVSHDPNWQRHQSDLQPLGIRACWLEPILSSRGEMLGLFVLFQLEVGVPDNLASELLREMALLSTLAIEHHHNVQNLHKLSLAVEYSPNAVMMTDARGIIEYVNPKFSEITGYQPEEALGQTPSILKSQQTEGNIHDDLWRTINSGEEWWGELRNLRKNGEAYWSKEHISPIKDSQGAVSHFVAIIEDVTEARLISEKVSYQATHDALTDLINRREFERILGNLVESQTFQKSHNALCFLDLDQFKVVNDTAGHVAGDELLRQLARMLKNHLRQGDILARLGGDEFAVLMEHCTAEQALRKSEQIRRMIEEYRFPWQDNIFAVGVSIGITEINGKTLSSLDALRQADMACYAAKDAGRNRIHIYKEDDKLLMERSGEMHSVNRIKRALEEDRFLLYAQPIRPVADRQHAASYEILLRMLDDRGELLPPGAFLPAAERYSLISRIDRWVIDQVFAWIYRHPLAMDSISGFSINLSGQSLGDDGLLGNIIRHLKTGRLPAKKLKFEITETAAIANLSNANNFIATLKEFGVEFALDDFGSGLSSFGYLKNLQVDYLKIDGMFVKDMLIDPIDSAMVKSINDIGHVMGMSTIAEFVENDEVLQALAALQVDFVQGYGVGRPMPIDEILGQNRSIRSVAPGGL